VGRCAEGGRRPTGERRPKKPFPQGVHSGAGAGSCHGPNRGGHGRFGDPQAQEGQLLPGFPGAAPCQREGADCSDPRGLCARRVDALSRRPGEGHGHDRHLQEPGVAAVRGDRRARQRVPVASDRGQLALPVDRRDLCEGARGREDRVRCRDNRCRGQHRRSARGAGP
jgi:hypothetical protein